MKILTGQTEAEYRNWKRSVAERETEQTNLRLELVRLGFDLSGVYDNPLNGIGSALRIAKNYGITLNSGTHFRQCRASLPKSAWRHPLRDDVDDYIINPWLKGRTKPEEVDEISVWAADVERAVAWLLITCRQAGII